MCDRRRATLEVCFQKVDVEGIAKNPVHLDIAAGDRGPEVERLGELGASVVEPFDAHTWMKDPEGNDFCVTD